MSYELRILNGLHRGAAMPLTDESLSMGASESADVVLVDPGIEQQHAKLSRTENGWIVLAEEGDLYAPEGADPQKAVDIGVGDFVRIGQVWMTIAEEGEPWAAPPPDPVPVAASADESLSDESLPLAETNADEEEGVAAEAIAEVETPQAAEEQAKQSESDGFNLRRLLAIPLAVVAVLSGAAAYAITAKSPVANEQKKPDINSDMKTHRSGQTIQASQADATGKKAAQKGNARLTPEELRQAFRKRMSDAGLLKRFDLSLQDDVWSMRGDLDEEETARFERVLKGFLEEYKIAFPVNASVVPTAEMLPFRISQVVSGNNASIITKDGNRLYVGDEYQGVRVVSINGNKLVFGGKRKIEVVW